MKGQSMGEAKRRQQAGTYPVQNRPKLVGVPGPSRLTFSSPADKVIAHLNHATVSEELYEVKSHIGFKIEVKRARGYDGAWGVPVFDFGGMDDTTDPEGFIGKAVTDECFGRASDLLMTGDLHLPFPECVLIYRYRETAEKYDTLNVVVVSETDGEITGNIFSKSFTHGGVTNQWRLEPLQFTLIPGGHVTLESVSGDVSLSAEWRREYEDDAKAKYTNIMVSLLLLARKAAIIEIEGGEMESPHQPMDGRQGLTPQPLIHRIKFNRVEFQKMADEGRGNHASPRPHIRRGHYRTLRSGRIVPVRPARIRGGSDDSNVYEASSAVAHSFANRNAAD
jgi:hypothetical protein